MRIAGLFYLIFIVFSFAADYTASFALTNAEDVVRRLLSNDLLFRMGIGFNLMSALFFLLSAWALYELLREHGRDLALLFLILNTVGVAIQSISCVFLLLSSTLSNSTEFAALLSSVDSQSLLRFLVSVYDTTFMSAQLFFSTWLLPLGILVYRSRVLPRALGLLLIADFAGILFWFFQHLLAPQARHLSTPALVVSFAAELGLALFLLLFRPKKRKS
jgi:hypothetical protein